MVTPQFGGPDLFEERNVERPHPGPGEVQVRVVAAGTNPVDAKFRADGSSAGLEAPIILGLDVSGVVGETILIHGGAGGVGSFAVQIAKAAGARILATASHHNQGVLKELGTDVAIDYSSQDVTEVALDDTGGKGVDAVFDSVGGGTIVESIPATKPFGRLATILGAQGDLTPLYQKNQILYGVFLMRERTRLEEMGRLIERGQVRPLVAEVLPLEEVGKAHERLDSGHGRGKVVLRVAEE